MMLEKNVQQEVDKNRQFFQTGVTRDVEFRVEALRTLQTGLRRHEADLLEALRMDLNKSAFEAYSSEVGMLLEEIRIVIKQLSHWAQPTKVKGSLALFGSQGYIYHEPFGNVLIISPWNYPLLLCLSPLIGALAAGNTAVLKPSELSVHTSSMIKRLIEGTIVKKYGEGYVTVIEGGVDTSTALLAEHFDYIFFTGGISVGRIVMEAAAKQLTPVTLELGGKSPCIVHRDADLRLAAKRIVWGKFMNSGQTCVAPDYVLVHEQAKQALLHHMQHFIAEFYGSDPLDRARTGLPSIISERHFHRLTNLLNETKGTVIIGGAADEERKLISPTIIDSIAWDDPLMESEIFGPILPVMTYTDIEREVVQPITARPKPLALYLFTSSSDIRDHVINRISFGGGCINDTVMHLASVHLPFGGTGTSGMGAYHGKHSFDLFSHHKSILKQTTSFDLPFRYPTMKNGLKWIKRFLK